MPTFANPVTSLLRALSRSRPAARRHGVPLARLIAEQLRLRMTTGISVDDYFVYGLDDPARSWQEKLAFVSARTIGWDLAVTPEGVFIVEGNACYTFRPLQFVANHGLAEGEYLQVYRELAALRRVRDGQ